MPSEMFLSTALYPKLPHVNAAPCMQTARGATPLRVTDRVFVGVVLAAPILHLDTVCVLTGNEHPRGVLDVVLRLPLPPRDRRKSVPVRPPVGVSMYCASAASSVMIHAVLTQHEHDSASDESLSRVTCLLSP